MTTLRFHETMGRRISANRVLEIVRKFQAYADASARGIAGEKAETYGAGYYHGKEVAFRCAADELNNLIG